jgi:adenine-specific DNA-methyltransferase
LYAENDNLLLYENPHYKTILDKIMDKGKFDLSHYVNINQGIVSGADKVSPSMLEKKLSKAKILEHNIKLRDPIFVHQEPGPLKPWMKAFYKNSHIKPYKVDISNHQWILYLTDEDELSSHDLPFQYLKAFKEVLQARRETKVGRRKWYALQWYRNQNIFESKKIVAPQRSRMNVFAYVEQPFYASADVYFLTGQPLKALLGILNSKLIFFWLYTRGKRKGKDLELYAKPLSQIPILDFSCINIIDLEAWVDQYLLKGDSKILEKIDRWVYGAYGLNDDEIKLIEALYEKRRRKDGQ